MNDVKGVVQRVEQHDDQADDESSLQKSEGDAKKFVEPTQHYDIEYSFQQSADEPDSYEYAYHYDRERCDMKDIRASLNVLAEPL